MKRNIMKHITVLAATAVLALSMAACGNTAKETEVTPAATETAAPAETPAPEATAEPAAEPAPETAEAPAAAPLTEEEYLTKSSELLTTISESLSVVESELSKFDESDLEGLKAFTEELKAPYQEFAALVAPEKYAATQAKFKSGCEAMIKYFDVCLEYMNPDLTEDDDKKLTAQLDELLLTTETDLSEAITMLSEASGVDLSE